MAQLTKQAKSADLLAQFEKPKFENTPFGDLEKNVIYHVIDTEQIHTRFGEKYVLTAYNIDEGKEKTVSVIAPDSYVKKCTYNKIDIDEPHFFVYKGKEKKTKIDSNNKKTKYEVHNIEILQKIDGYVMDIEDF